MGDVFDYIEWRGDILVKGDPVNDVDLLILCRLSYIPFGGVVSADAKEPVSLKRAAQTVLDLVRTDERQLTKKEDQRLLEALIDAPRFNTMRLCCFTEVYNEALEEQFGAVTILPEDGTATVLFRGTDGTLVGWKEDFNMSFTFEIPAQKDSLQYLKTVAAQFPEKKMRIAGHSKGGNLAMYAATFCCPEIQNRILAVRNLDGPGFNEYQMSARNFSRIADVTRTILPDSSIIGMLLAHTEESVIVESQSVGLFQHNLYLWQIRRSGFITKDERSGSSHVIDRTLKDWLGSLTKEQRERMIDGLFLVLQSSDGKTLRELWSGKNGLAILSTAVKLDPETRGNIDTGLKLLRKALKNNLTAEHTMKTLIEHS